LSHFIAPGPLPPAQGSFGSFVRCWHLIWVSGLRSQACVKSQHRVVAVRPVYRLSRSWKPCSPFARALTMVCTHYMCHRFHSDFANAAVQPFPLRFCQCSWSSLPPKRGVTCVQSSGVGARRYRNPLLSVEPTLQPTGWPTHSCTIIPSTSLPISPLT